MLAHILMTGCVSQKKSNSYVTLNHSSVEEPLQALVSWIASQLQSSAGSSLSLVIPALMALMSCPEPRTIFANSGGIGYLSRHLKRRQIGAIKRSKIAGASVQQLYELCFCMWTLTYDCNSSAAVRTHFARGNVVAALVDLVTAAPREKVVRVALSALRNLATCTTNASPGPLGKRVLNGSYFLTEMIGCGLNRSLDRMKERKWTDPDVTEGTNAVVKLCEYSERGEVTSHCLVSHSWLIADLDVLYNLLHETYKLMSRWDVYQAEVESGHLEWGVVHSEKFFKEHAKRLEGKNGDFTVLRVSDSMRLQHYVHLGADPSSLTLESCLFFRCW